MTRSVNIPNLLLTLFPSTAELLMMGPLRLRSVSTLMSAAGLANSAFSLPFLLPLSRLWEESRVRVRPGTSLSCRLREVLMMFSVFHLVVSWVPVPGHLFVLISMFAPTRPLSMFD